MIRKSRGQKPGKTGFGVELGGGVDCVAKKESYRNITDVDWMNLASFWTQEKTS